MKIRILGPAHPYRGGIAKFNEVLAASFGREGHDVKIVSFTLQYPAFLFPGRTQYTRMAAPEGVAIERRINSVNPLNWPAVGREIARERPDLLIPRFWMPFMGPSLGTIARTVRRYSPRTRVVALADNIVPHEHRPGDRPLTGYFLRQTDAVVYMSDEVGRDLDSFGYRGLKAMTPHPIYDVYGPPVSKAEACEALRLDPATDYVLFFGFIRDYKGLDLLLEAWARLRAEGKTGGKKLLIGGEYYGNKEKYDTLIRSLGLADEVIVHDRYIDENEVRHYFGAADLVVQPYKSATQSGVTQIAYHFGVPMVVTRVGGLPEIVPDGRTGYVVDVDPGAIAEAIARFYDQRKAEEFRACIGIEKKRFGWEALTGTFFRLYEEIEK
ncbi:glycosyltransferase [Rikenella microfusus]|uniref:glycosyltransferase n=1 Tax=Rikenella microfusus TaxID=28139 RepID=UPI001DFE31B8|nr:glycosyltransferase [Rikenella microfusus]HJE89109.1 glycosyltransferase [Rikenella microfusus]